MKVPVNVVSKYMFFSVLLFIGVCGGCFSSSGSSSGSSSESSSVTNDVIDDGSSGPLTGTIIVDWTYPPNTGVKGFRVYVYDDEQLSIVTLGPLNSDSATDYDISFPASELGNDEDESFYFVIEAYQGHETVQTDSICFTAKSGMNSCP